LEKQGLNKFVENMKSITDEASKRIDDLASNVSEGANKVAHNVSDFAKNKKDTVGSKEKKVIETIENKTPKKSVDEKKISLDNMLQNAVNEYNQAFTYMNDCGMNLYVERERSKDLIIHIENLINSIAHHPKSFDVDIDKMKMYREEFQEVCDFAKEELAAAKRSAVGAGSGVAAGATVASVAPTAAMWIASTFGTASTGTAISSLSGGAATNAALAWIGGGTLATGGGGMSAGTAFLAMAGPIGWSIAGVTIFASVALFAKNKMKTNKERKEAIEKVKINTESVRESAAKISTVLIKTENLRTKLNDQYGKYLLCYGKSFMDISGLNQTGLGTLVNNTKSLAATLAEKL